MKRRSNLLERIADYADLKEENVTALPLLEVCGFQRVIIEQHRGVIEYGTKRITVRIKDGAYSVCGSDLSLCRMCNRQLLIRGNIEQVELLRRNC